MIEIILFTICLVACGLSFYLGKMIQKDIDERAPARVIRPANVKVEKHYIVREYTVTDNALDIDFPEVEKIR